MSPKIAAMAATAPYHARASRAGGVLLLWLVTLGAVWMPALRGAQVSPAARTGSRRREAH